MYSLYHDNRNKCVSLIPHFDECCNYYMDKGLHVDGKLFDEVGLVSSVVGDIKMSVRSTDYEGWLVCDGRSLLRTDYSALYELIGTSFGSNDSETFKLPNAQGRVLGSVTSNLTTNNLSIRCVGDLVGAETHTLTIPQIPSHNHSIIDNGHEHTITDNGHSHDYFNQNNNQSVNNVGLETAADQSSTNQTTLDSTTGISINLAYTGITTGNIGGSEAHNNMQPTLFIGNTFIYCGVKNTDFVPIFHTPCSNTYVIPPCLD